MEAVNAEQVGGRAVRRDGAFATTNNSREIVVEQRNGMFAHIGDGSEHVLVAQNASQLEVTVGNGARHVQGGDDVSLDVRGKRLAPNITAAIRQEPHSAHAPARGVAGTDERGSVGDEFSEASRT